MANTTADKLNRLNATKIAIKEAIISKGQSVSSDDTFASYAQKIENIETGIDTTISGNITIEPTYTATGDITLNPETGYYGKEGTYGGTLTMNIDLQFAADIVISCKGRVLVGGMSFYTISIDGKEFELNYDDTDYVDTIISNVKPGPHTIYFEGSSEKSTTILWLKAMPITGPEPAITSGNVLYGNRGFVNGQKIIGGYIPLDTSDATATATDIVRGKTAYNNDTKVIGTVNAVTSGVIFTNRQQLSTTSNSVKATYKYDILMRGSSYAEIRNDILADAITLTADKIKKDETILSVTGTYDGGVADALNRSY